MNRILISLMLLFLGTGIALSQTEPDPDGFCYLEVDQIEYIIGNCTIDQDANKDGSKMIRDKIDNGKWWAKAEYEGDKGAIITWGPVKANKDHPVPEAPIEATWEENESGWGCLVSDRIKMCASPSTTPVDQTFMKQGHCLFESKGKTIIKKADDCIFFRFSEVQSEDGYDLTRSKLVVLNDKGTVTAMVISTSEPTLGGSGTLYQVLTIGEQPALADIGGVEADGACWVASDSKLCVWKGGY